MTTNKHLRIGILVVLALTVSACTGLEIGIETTPTPGGLPPTETPVATPSTTPPPLSTPTRGAPTPLPAGWTTFRDNRVGFEIDHPADWVVDSSDMLAILWSRRVEGPGNDGVPADVTKIDVVSDPNLPASIDALVEQQRRNVAEMNGQVLSEETVTLSGGLPARVLRISSMAESWSLYTVINGRGLIVVGYGDLGRVPDVALSLRAVTPRSGVNADCAVIYTDGSNLMCASTDGQAWSVAFVPDAMLSSLRVSPDGAWVAFLVGRGDERRELYALNLNEAGEQPLRLVTADQIPNADPARVNSPQTLVWAPDSASLYFDTRFSTVDGSELGPGDHLNADLWQVDLATQTVRALLEAGRAGAFAPSPDGSQIAVTTPRSLGLLSADGSNYGEVFQFPPVNTASESAYLPMPVWLRDGAGYMVVIPEQEQLVDTARTLIYRIRTDGQVLEFGAIPADFFGGIRPALSSDGRFVVYSDIDPTNGQADVYLSNNDGSAPVLAATGTNLRGWTWSPDSTRFTVSFGDGTSQPVENLIVAVEGPAQPFAPGLFPITVAWADPTRLVLLALEGDTFGLYAQTLGEEARALVSGLGRDSEFAVR